MSTKISKINAINSIHQVTPAQGNIVDLNSRISEVRKTSTQESHADSEIDWRKKSMEMMIMQFARAMYDPDSEIYIGERDVL